MPITNNAAEKAIPSLALRRKNFLFVGSQQAGKRSVVVLMLIESARLNEHDLCAYLKDVFARLLTLKHRDLATLLWHDWHLADAATPLSPS